MDGALLPDALTFGCRISETAPRCEHVRLDQDEVFFEDVKNGINFTAPIPPEAKSFLARLVARGGAHIFHLPADAPRVWNRFFKKTGLRNRLPGVSFHSTRVTVVSRMARNPEVKSDMARAAVNHSSELVHRCVPALASAQRGRRAFRPSNPGTRWR